MPAESPSYSVNILAWCRDFVEKIANFVDKIAEILDLKIFELLNPFNDIPIIGDVVNWLNTAGGLFNSDWTLLELMFGAGLPLFIAFVFVKFVLDIIF